MTIQRGDCGHLKSHLDNHKKCIYCSHCSRESTCSTCSSWSNLVWVLAENRRSKKKDMSSRKKSQTQSVSSDKKKKKKHGSTALHGITGRGKTHIGGNALGTCTQGSTSPPATGHWAMVTGYPMTDPPGNGQLPNGQEDTSSRPGIPGNQVPSMPGNQVSPGTSHQVFTNHQANGWGEIQESPGSGHTRSPGSRPPGTRHQSIASDSQTFGADFTSKQPGTPRVLLPLEPDFSNMSDPSVVIEPPGNNRRSDNNNNNDNYRQNQTSFSCRRSRRDQSREKHRHKKRRRRRSFSSSSSSSYSSSGSRKRKSRRSKHSHKKRSRRYTSLSSSLSVSHSQICDYGRYQRKRYSPQAVQNPQVLQPEEVPNIQTITPEQVIPRPSRDSGSDNESETWSFDRAINEVFRLLPPELCPRQTEEHSPYLVLSY